MPKYYIVLFFSLLLSSELSSQCELSIFPLTMQCEINEFAEKYGQCDTLIGNLRIEYNFNIDEEELIVDLSPLKFIKYITGNIAITGIDGIENLDGFESLIHVSRFSVSNCKNLLNFDKVEDLQYLESIFIQNNSSLERVPELHFDSLDFAVFSQLPITDFQFLNGVEKINVLDVFNNGIITSCEGLNDELELGAVFLRNNPLLSECAIEAICEKIGGDFGLLVLNNGVGCSSIEELAEQCYPDSLICLQSCLNLNGQDEVNELWGIEPECLKNVEKIVIENKSGSKKVTDLSALMRFKSLDILRLDKLDSLVTLDGVQNLESIGQLDIFRCNSLVTLDEFKSDLEIGRKIVLVENLALNSLGSFMTSNQIPLVDIRSCPQLTQGEYNKLGKAKGLIFNSIVLENSDFINLNPNLETLQLFNVEGNLDLNLENTIGISDLRIEFQHSPISLRNVVFADSVTNIFILQNEIPIWSIVKYPIHINQIVVINNAFQSFDFESNIISIDRLSFENNYGIMEIDFLDDLEYINNFILISNYDLVKVGSTSNLTDNLVDFALIHNPLLEDIEGFDNEITSGNIVIEDNPVLNDCTIGILCNTLSSRAGSVDIVANGEDCDYDNVIINCDTQNPLKSIIIRNQSDIDELELLYPSMDSIFGSLSFIFDSGIDENTIDLSFFKQLKYIEDEFIVTGSKSSYFDFSKFDNCFYGGLDIFKVDALRLPIYHGGSSLSKLSIINSDIEEGLIAFQGLEETGLIRISSFLDIKNNGFFDVKKVGTIELTDIDIANSAFENLASVDNLRLNDLGIDNISMFSDTYLEKGLDIDFCYDLLSIDLDQFTYSYNNFQLIIESNSNLVSISGLNVDRSYRKFSVTIKDNASLNSINILETAEKVSTIRIYRNEILNLITFPSLEKGGFIILEENPSLESINLNSLKDLTRIEIEDNMSLATIKDINNTADIELIQLVNNPNLIECNVDLICHNYNLNNILEINDNTGACTVDELLNQCTNNVSNEELLNFDVYPNPSQSKIRSDIFNDLREVTLIDMFGIEKEIRVESGTVNLDGLSPGLYIISAMKNDLQYTSKVIFRQ